MIPVFETDRLFVRELVVADFDSMHLLCSNAEVMKFVGNLQPYSAPQTRQAILKCLRSYGINGFGGCAIHFKDAVIRNGEPANGIESAGDRTKQTPGPFAGYGGFEYVPERKMPELFYIFSPEYWGKGLASEFAIAAVEFGINKLKMPKIGTSFDPSNEASMKVARKAGFTFSHEALDEFKLPTIYYEIGR